MEEVPFGLVTLISQVTSAICLSVSFGFEKKIRTNNRSSRLTVFAVLNRGIVFEGVSHLACQSASGVTTNQPAKPLTALRNSVFGTGLPFSSFQNGSADAPVGKHRNN